MDWGWAVIVVPISIHAWWLYRGEKKSWKRRQTESITVELSPQTFRHLAIATLIANLIGVAGWLVAHTLQPGWWAACGVLTLIPALAMYRIAELTFPFEAKEVLAGECHPKIVTVLILSGVVWAFLWGWELSRLPAWVYFP